MSDSESTPHFIQHVPAAVAVFDAELRYLHVSDRWLEECGLTGEDLLGRYHYEVVPDLPERWKAGHRRVLAGATEVCDRDVFLRSDGTTEWIQWRLQPWFRHDDTIGGIIMFTQVITDRVKLEEALRTSEERFRSAIKYSPLGMAIVEPDGRILECNPALSQIVGYSTDELRDVSWSRLTHVDHAEHDRAELRRLADGEIDSYEAECRFVHRTGRVIWVQLNVSAIRNIHGRPCHYVCQVHDITVRKANESSLQKTTAKLTLAMDMARLGYWEFDVPKGRFTLDEGCYRVFGTTSGEFRKLHWSVDDYCREFLPLADAVVFRTELECAVAAPATAVPRQLNHLFKRRDQSSGIMAVRFSTLEDGTGQIVKVYGVNQDMSETKRMEHQQRTLEVQLRHAQRLEAIGTLAGGVAHEFNNLLTAIMGNIQLAELDLADGRAPQSCLREATNSCREARDLVNRLLTFSQQAQPKRRALPFASVVQSALQEVSRSLPTTIQLQVAIGSSSPLVRCDALEIGQVLQQIAANAAQAMVERGGVLDVSLRPLPADASWRARYPQIDARQTVWLSLRDTGIGMSPSLLNRVFDPFFTTKPFGQGAGLGLPMVRGIMKRHGGSVVIESSPGAGTTVHLLFPEAPAEHDTTETRT